MLTDVDMKDSVTQPPASEEQDCLIDEEKQVYEDIWEQLRLVEKGVLHKEMRYLHRVLRILPHTKKRLTKAVFPKVLTKLAAAGLVREKLLELCQLSPGPPSSTRGAHPECELYVHLLTLLYLMDCGSEKAAECADDLVAWLDSNSRPSLDPLAAHCYFYFSRAYELQNKLPHIRSYLLSRLRTSTLHHETESMATLLNLVLRSYLSSKLYGQAERLASRCVFPEAASNSEWARYFYYMGLIQAIRLEYSDSYKNLQNALRKAPQQRALGFKQTVHKVSIVVQLLLGEIPDRKTFREPYLRKTLQPYLQLSQAVRLGDLMLFSQVIEKYQEKFFQENTFALIIRLHHNVIKAGVRMISLSYSRISLADVARILLLDSAKDAEYIIAKAIKDGVIDAEICHSGGYVSTKEILDVYSTSEPQQIFNERTKFCLDIYNQSVKAMWYPPKSYSKDLALLEEQREREKQDLEYAKEMAEEEDDYS